MHQLQAVRENRAVDRAVSQDSHRIKKLDTKSRVERADEHILAGVL
jgi:hypothetical protein